MENSKPGTFLCSNVSWKWSFAKKFLQDYFTFENVLFWCDRRCRKMMGGIKSCVDGFAKQLYTRHIFIKFESVIHAHCFYLTFLSCPRDVSLTNVMMMVVTCLRSVGMKLNWNLAVHVHSGLLWNRNRSVSVPKKQICGLYIFKCFQFLSKATWATTETHTQVCLLLNFTHLQLSLL